MAGHAAAHPDRRAENFEIKGHKLLKPSSARIRRNRIFTQKALSLCRDLGAALFSVIWTKDSGNPVNPVSMYTHSLQILAERFHYHCLANNDQGIIVADSRTDRLDFTVASSHLSFLLGNPAGRAYVSLVEAPMFVDSCLSAGAQLADILGACIFGYYFQKNCARLPGLFVGPNPVTPEDLAENPGGPWVERTPARDYSHCRQYWADLNALQFKRTDVAPPRPNLPAPGFYGFREVT